MAVEVMRNGKVQGVWLKCSHWDLLRVWGQGRCQWTLMMKAFGITNWGLDLLFSLVGKTEEQGFQRIGFSKEGEKEVESTFEF